MIIKDNIYFCTNDRSMNKIYYTDIEFDLSNYVAMLFSIMLLCIQLARKNIGAPKM